MSYSAMSLGVASHAADLCLCSHGDCDKHCPNIYVTKPLITITKMSPGLKHLPAFFRTSALSSCLACLIKSFDLSLPHALI